MPDERCRTRIERLALELVALCDAISRQLCRRAAGLDDQIGSAAASVLANVGEALDEESMGDKRRFFRYALRSAGECQRLMRGAHRIRAISDADADRVLRLIGDIKMDLIRLIRWTRM